MKQKIPQPEFGKNEDKPFEGDRLNRKKEINTLTPMITKMETPATMALDAEWGAGKTAFIKMWKAHLNNTASARAFYFNAWETDFAADPLAPFTAAIAKQLPKPNDSTELVEKAKTLIPVLVGDVVYKKAKMLLPVLVGDIVRKFVGKGTAQVAENAIEQLLVHNNKTTEFQDTLKDFAAAQKGKRVVIFVDELDRCRPDYAVKVLERIKHLFEVPGVIFVLATNRTQLCHSINAFYGANFDADAYLRRFIEFDYTIKTPDMGAFIDALFEGLGINAFLSDKSIEIIHTRVELHRTLALLLAKIHNLSLRDVEQLLMRVVLALSTLEKNLDGKNRVSPELLVFLIVARQKMRKFYHRYIQKGDWHDIVGRWESDFFAASHEWRFDEREYVYEAASFITSQIIAAEGLASSDSFIVSEIITRYEKKAAAATTVAQRWYYEGVIRFIRDISENHKHRIDVRRIADKIEMLDRFHLSEDDSTQSGGG